MVNGKKQYTHFTMRLPGIPRNFIHLFLIDLMRYRGQDAHHGSRSSGVYGNLEFHETITLDDAKRSAALLLELYAWLVLGEEDS